MHSLQRREKSTFETIPPRLVYWGQVLNPYAWGKRSVPSEQIKTNSYVESPAAEKKKHYIPLSPAALVSEESTYEILLLFSVHLYSFPPKIQTRISSVKEK